jgi:hypothetical protein
VWGRRVNNFRGGRELAVCFVLATRYMEVRRGAPRRAWSMVDQRRHVVAEDRESMAARRTMHALPGATSRRCCHGLQDPASAPTIARTGADSEAL